MAIPMVFLVQGSPDYKHCGKPDTAGFSKSQDCPQPNCNSSINEDPLDLDANSYDSEAHADHLSFPLNCSSNSSVVNNSSNSYISYGSKRVDDDKCSPKFVVSALSLIQIKADSCTFPTKISSWHVELHT